MKIYNSLPDSITTPTGQVLKPYVGGKTNKEIIAVCKSVGATYRQIRVLPSRLRGRNDLYGKEYQPNIWIFTSLEDDNSPQRSYLVTWVIDIEAKSPEEAAKQAFEIMQREGTTATCFEVKDKASKKKYDIDLHQL